MPENATLRTLARTMTLTWAYGAARPDDRQSAWQRTAIGYRCTLTYRGRRYTFDYWMGRGCQRDPDAESCLDCLLGDARAGEQTFEEFCSEFSYDTDSRRAEATWKACRRAGRGLRRLLGADFETFLYADRG
jgi:hypothetical protein